MCECRDCDNFKAKKSGVKVSDRVNDDKLEYSGVLVGLNVISSLGGLVYTQDPVSAVFSDSGVMCYSFTKNLTVTD